VGTAGRTKQSRRRWLLALGLACAGVLVWGGSLWWTARRYRAAIAAIEAEIASGRFAIAARDLAKLLAWKPDSDEAAYLLGTCEQARGRPDEAEGAFARIPPGSAFWYRAVLARLRLFHDGGRLGDAEQLIEAAAEDHRTERGELDVLLVPIFSEQSRLDDAERVVEAQWEHLNATGERASEAAVKLIRLHMELTLNPIPVETIRARLDERAARAPDDDRVWLGQANLALRTGDYDAAGRLLDACLKRRPEDAAVWRARLRWGVATDQVEIVKAALRNLPATESNAAGVQRLAAWLASKRGDSGAERRGLERLLAADPADRKALERLAQLAEKDGEPARAAELLRKQEEIRRLKARYEKLYDRKQPFRDAAELARLAEQLGRPFEARACLTVAVSEKPDRADLRAELVRLSRSPATVAKPGESLAEAIAHEAEND
jgi:thioredoxin-like negative regulator of GroEL